MTLPRQFKVHGLIRWSAALAVLTLAPKCLLCVVGYFGLGAALGFSGREICGGAPDALAGWALPVATVSVLAGAGLGWRLRQHRHCAATGPQREQREPAP